jgi:hypothetical protein
MTMAKPRNGKRATKGVFFCVTEEEMEKIKKAVKDQTVASVAREALFKKLGID